MKRRVAKADVEDDDLPDPEPDQGPAGGYRIAGDVQFRSAELEQELGQTKDRLRAAERELYAARKVIRRRKARRALTAGSIGTVFGLAVSVILYAAGWLESPGQIIFIESLCFVFGALFGMRWDDNHDNFPQAPPPRFQ